MLKFYSSGQIGDIIYALSAIKKLSEIKNEKALIFLPSGYFGNLKKFLMAQEYIESVELYFGQMFDYNLDLFRLDNDEIFDIHLIQSYYKIFDIPLDSYNKPWLTLNCERHIEYPYNILNLTERYRGSFNWEDFLETTDKEFIFLGLEKEFEDAKKIDKFNKIKSHYKTSNIFEVAEMVYNAKEVYCNQSMVLTLAQGFGKKYFLDLCLKPVIFKNVLLHTENENILNLEEYQNA